MVGVSVNQRRKLTLKWVRSPKENKGEIKMNYKEFMKITDKWSDLDKVSFLMDYELWGEMIMRFIMHKWHDEVVELEHIAWFANDHGIMHYTDLPEVEE